jgi:hypothetical protein
MQILEPRRPSRRARATIPIVVVSVSAIHVDNERETIPHSVSFGTESNVWRRKRRKERLCRPSAIGILADGVSSIALDP